MDVKVNAKYMLTQKVYLEIDLEQIPYLITGIVVRPEGFVEYFISDGHEEFLVREFELREDKNILFN